jgi:hypothetical protein
MSYYGIRKMKYKQTQAGMWTVACEYYDSSIWGYDDKRVWNTTEEFVKPFNTKEELDDFLFQNFLDGNFHGSFGKFACLNWNNSTLKYTDEEQEQLNLNGDRYYKEKSIDYEQYNFVRYAISKQAWERQLANKDKFIVKLDFQGYKNIFVKSVGSRYTRFAWTINEAKKFKGVTKEELMKTYCNNPKYSNVQVIALEK